MNKIGGLLVTGLLLFATHGFSRDVTPSTGSSVYRLTQYSIVNVEMETLSCNREDIGTDREFIKTVALNIGFGRRSTNDVQNTIYLVQESDPLLNCDEIPQNLPHLTNAALLLDAIVENDVEVEITHTNPPIKTCYTKTATAITAAESSEIVKINVNKSVIACP